MFVSRCKESERQRREEEERSLLVQGLCWHVFQLGTLSKLEAHHARSIEPLENLDEADQCQHMLVSKTCQIQGACTCNLGTSFAATCCLSSATAQLCNSHARVVRL